MSTEREFPTYASDYDKGRLHDALKLLESFGYAVAFPKDGEAVPVAWTLRFRDNENLNVETTFGTPEEANGYVDRCSIRDVCDRNPRRPTVVPLYLAPQTREPTIEDAAFVAEFVGKTVDNLWVHKDDMLAALIDASMLVEVGK